MKYIIDKNTDNMKLVTYKININGLKIKPANKKFKEILLVDNKLINAFIKKRINKKLNKIINFMMEVLNDETGDDDSSLALDELNKLKGIINNKYKEHMIQKDYDSFINKISIVEDEFKKNYTQKQYLNYLSGDYYIEETTTRGR